MLGERQLKSLGIVEGHHDGLGRGFGGNAGRAWAALGGHARAGRGQQAVGVAVVAAGELDDQVPPGGTPGQPDGGHAGLGTGGDQAHQLRRLHPGADGLGQFDLGRGGGAERQPTRRRRLNCGDHLGMGVPEQRRPPGTDRVHVLAAIGVVEVGALGAGDEDRVAAHRPEAPDRRGHPAGNHGTGPLEQAHRRSASSSAA